MIREVLGKFFNPEFAIGGQTVIPLEAVVPGDFVDALDAWIGDSTKTLGELMTWVMYDPEHGFYQTHVPMSSYRFDESTNTIVENPWQVYVTFAAEAPLLARMLAYELLPALELAKHQGKERIVTEVAGDGSGLLSRSILRSLFGSSQVVNLGMVRDPASPQLELHMVEITKSLHELQKHTLSEFLTHPAVVVKTHLADAVTHERPPLDFVYSLELLDQLPPEVLVRSNGEVWQMYVRFDRSKRGFLTWWDTPNQQVQSYLKANADLVKNKPTVHVPCSVELVASYAQQLEAGGTMVMVDYFDTQGAPALDSLRNRGLYNEMGMPRRTAIQGQAAEVYGLLGLAYAGLVDTTTHVPVIPLVRILATYGDVEVIPLYQQAERLMKIHGEADKPKLREASRQLGSPDFQVVRFVKKK